MKKKKIVRVCMLSEGRTSAENITMETIHCVSCSRTMSVTLFSIRLFPKRLTGYKRKCVKPSHQGTVGYECCDKAVATLYGWNQSQLQTLFLATANQRKLILFAKQISFSTGKSLSKLVIQSRSTSTGHFLKKEEEEKKRTNVQKRF